MAQKMMSRRMSGRLQSPFTLQRTAAAGDFFACLHHTAVACSSGAQPRNHPSARPPGGQQCWPSDASAPAHRGRDPANGEVDKERRLSLQAIDKRPGFRRDMSPRLAIEKVPSWRQQSLASEMRSKPHRLFGAWPSRRAARKPAAHRQPPPN
jgi:hypothetical protein